MTQRIRLVDISVPMIEAWQEMFITEPWTNEQGELDIFKNITIEQGSIFQTPCDAIVSPANSFGFMGGGLDGVLSKYLGWHVQERVQRKIRDEFDGELLVGQSLIVPTDNNDFPYLISAPTMRVSMTLADRTKMSPNIYLASKAIFLALRKNPHIKSVAIPGLGTGVGGVPPIECARKMRMAYEDFYLGQYKFPATFSDAHDRHTEQTKVEQVNGQETV
jgi:O-acetyl-ADP-ribose deacetylase (regulator of RNase III)